MVLIINLTPCGSKSLEESAQPDPSSWRVCPGWRLALDLLDFIGWASSISPDLYTFNCSLSACASKAWLSAMALLGGVAGHGWQPDVVTYGVVAKMEAWHLASLALGGAKERQVLRGFAA